MENEMVSLVLTLLAGIALFMFSMSMIEESVKNFASRSFKLFLQRITGNKLVTVCGSAMVTGILQGSSVMMAMLMSFVGAGVLSLGSAVAVILGANLGTTIDSWIVASVGFKMDLGLVANPAIILAGVLMVISPQRYKYHSRFLLGLGLLLLSVSIMKQSVSGTLGSIPLYMITGLPLWLYVIIGVIVTAILQSSLATMTLALSALHTGVLNLDIAIALVIGSEVGTTLKLFLGAMDGFSPKKRLAMANLVINIVTALLAFILMKPILGLINGLFFIHDPLFILVAFQSSANILSVLLFIPFVDKMALLLSSVIRDDDNKLTAYIFGGEVANADVSFELFLKESFSFISAVMVFNLKTMGIESSSFPVNPDFASIEERRGLLRLIPSQHYDALKVIHGELQLYYIKMRNENHPAGRLDQLEDTVAAVRHAMHAAKGIRDITSNISNLTRSSKFVKFDIYQHACKNMSTFYEIMEKMILSGRKTGLTEILSLYEQINRNYTSVLEHIYEQTSTASISNTDFTMMMNFNRELFSSNRSMLMAVAGLILDTPEVDQFNERVLYAA